MMKISQFIAVSLAVCCSIFGAPAHAQFFGNNPSHLGAGSFSAGEGLRQGNAIQGVIVSARPVRIEPSSVKQYSTIATMATLGGMAGAAIGKGRGNKAAVILGTFLGGIGGEVVANAALATQAIELIVRTTDNRLMVIVQAPDGQELHVGSPCFIVSTSGNSRVISAPTAQDVVTFR